MRHLTIDVSNYDSRLHIGKQGENLTREITFDCAAWLDGLTGGALSIVHQRPSDPDAYPCGNYVTDDTSLTWSINETDVAFSGLGKCELRYTIGSRIAKTKTFYTEIVNALNPLDTPPEAWEPYIDRVIDAATQEMENMTASASATSGEQTSVSVTKTRENDHEHLAFDFTVEKGDKGEDGKSIVNVTASIDANVGTPSVTVTTSSSDAGLSVDLDFHNMKGIPGADFDTSYLPSDTASGSPATFTDGAKNVPVDELITAIVPAQAGSGTPSPSNPRAISGWTQAEITHNGDTDTIPFGQTVYGGELNVTTGVLTINKGYISDLSQLTWTYPSATYRYIFSAAISDIYSVSQAADRNKWFVCSEYVPSVGTSINNTMTDCGALVVNQTLRLRNDAYENDIDNFVTSLSGVQFVYRLADEITVQLTPAEVRTVLGNNSILANTGSVSVRYRADIGLYIDKKLA